MGSGGRWMSRWWVGRSLVYSSSTPRHATPTMALYALKVCARSDPHFSSGRQHAIGLGQYESCLRRHRTTILGEQRNQNFGQPDQVSIRPEAYLISTRIVPTISLYLRRIHSSNAI